MERKTHTIDATGQILGRLASHIAILLQGKHKPDFFPYKDMGDFVVVKNIKNLKVTGKKMEQKKYFWHSGYIGGAREMSLKELFKTRPGEVLETAVLGMLPKNRLRAKMIKRLKVE